MSVEPFNTMRQADDFFRVVLHTRESLTNVLDNPQWLINPSGDVVETYKAYRKCIAVVDWLDIQSLADQDGIVVRDVSNMQMNSSDSVTSQSNIIYYAQSLSGASNKNETAQSVGFPYHKANPFGIQELRITKVDTTAVMAAITEDWSIQITYYFYY